MNHYIRDTPYPYQAIIAIIIFFSLALCAKKKSILYPNGNPKKILWLCLLYSLFSFCDGDYYHYKEIFIERSVGHEVWGIEPIYLLFIDTSPIYLFFRLCIWGLGLYFIFLSAKELGIWSNKFGYLFVIFNLLLYSYARVSLAISMAVYGYILVIKNNKTILRISGLVLLYFSYFFHKSVIIILLLIPFTFIPWGKKTLWVGLLCLPIGIYFINNYAIDYLLNINLTESQENAVNGYIFQGNYNDQRGVVRYVLDIVVQISTYIGLVIMIVNNEFQNQSKEYNFIFRWTALICLCATGFVAFPFSRVLYYRLMYIARIPEIFTLSILLKNNQTNNNVVLLKLFIMSCWVYDFMKLLYSFYLSIVQ